MEQTKKPILLKLKKGTRYSICSCGISKRLPFCDGRHKELNEKTNGTYKSIKITPSENIDIVLDCANWTQ